MSRPKSKDDELEEILKTAWKRQKWAKGHTIMEQGSQPAASRTSTISHVKNATVWLLKRFWNWGPLAWIVGTVCIGMMGIFLAPEGIYALVRGMVIAGAVLFVAKLIHDAKSQDKPLGELVALSSICVLIAAILCFGSWVLISDIEWKNEVLIRTTFKSSPLFTERRERRIIWNLNKYYRYLVDVGFDLPKDIPPIGVSAVNGPVLSGGGESPYVSHLIVPENQIDDPRVLRIAYSIHVFDLLLVDPDAYRTGLSRSEAQDDEEAAWIFACYFDDSFSGLQACADDAPGNRWVRALSEVRTKYGQDYADGLVYYTVRQWRNVPSQYVDNFDRFFRNKLSSGESVKDNSLNFLELNAIFSKYGLDVTQP